LLFEEVLHLPLEIRVVFVDGRAVNVEVLDHFPLVVELGAQLAD
jgi:hypothetical protein